MIVRISFIILLIAIAYLSLTPTDTLTIGNDKISHFIAYSTLMLNAGVLTYGHKNRFIIAIIFCLLYGAIMEIGQDYVPGRFMSIHDMYANGLGVVIGAVLSFFFARGIRHLLQKMRLI